MKLNLWTVGLAAGGVVSLASVVSAEEAPSQVMTALSSTTLSGYVDTSIMWKPGTGNGFIPGRAFDGGMGNPGGNKLDGFNLNVVKLKLEKALDEGSWSAGYTIGLLLGPDGNGYNASTASFGSGDFAVKDAYVTVRAPIGNGLDFKLGTFSTIIGYEVFESPENPNFSRSFGWQLEPTQHTGLLATYKVNDMISLNGGIANTWSAGINARTMHVGFFSAAGGTPIETEKTYMGSVTVTAPDTWGVLKDSSFYAGVVEGFSGNKDNTESWYTGATLKTPVEGLSVGAAFDYRVDGVNFLTGSQNWAWAAALYGSFAATEKLKFNARGDYTRGSDGTWYDAGTPYISDHSNELIAFTGTVDYTLWDNVLSRAEVRWDHSLTGTKVYDFGTRRNVVTLALNLVYKF